MFIRSLCVLIFLLPSPVWAACSWSGNTGTAASLSVSDIEACVSDASSKTGEVIINLPAGSATWSDDVDVNMSSGFTNVTKLSIIGAGTIPTGTTTGSASSGGTTISNSTTAVSFIGTSTKQFRFANVKFTGTGTKFSITGTSRPETGGGWRIDHITADVTGQLGTTSGRTYGVFDHIHANRSGQVFNVQDGSGGQASQDSFERDDYIGTGNSVFVEDSEIYCDSGCASPVMLCDLTQGGRVTVRHSKIRNHYLGGHDSLQNRGGVYYAAYDNELYQTDAGDTDGDVAEFRGGYFVFYNNAIFFDYSTGHYCSTNCGVHFRVYRATPGCGGNSDLFAQCCSDSQTAYKGCLGDGANWSDSYCSSDADCGGATGSCVYIDDPHGDGKGYPCRDQIGWATVDMEARPSLLWNNTVKIQSADPVPITVCVSDPGTSKLQADRDWCISDSTMPATCNGVTTTYTEYTYPHPLRDDAAAVSSITGISITGGSFR